MDFSRWAMVYLLLVVSGGAILVADIALDFTVSTGNYEVPFGLMTGFAFLTGGVFRFIEIADQRRTRTVGWFGVIVGLLVFVVDGFTISGSLIYYAGVAVLVLTGAVLFSMVFETGQQGTKT